MRDVQDDEGRRFRPATLFAWLAATVISGAVVYNSLFAQTGGARDFAGAGDVTVPEGATTRMQVDSSEAGGRTIQLKYDPVVEEVQRQLLGAGYYRGLVDGVIGKRTRQAVEAYQRAEGLEVTGEPTTSLAEHIRYTREIAEASLFTGTVGADPEAEARAQVRRVQTGLAELAYSPGEISGEMNSETHRAIKQFQHDRGLAETGDISDGLMAELTKLSGQSELKSN
jgi:peptidoglycan hydrolase-like protein with peptidoglycan-binding domain